MLTSELQIFFQFQTFPVDHTNTTLCSLVVMSSDISYHQMGTLSIQGKNPSAITWAQTYSQQLPHSGFLTYFHSQVLNSVENCLFTICRSKLWLPTVPWTDTFIAWVLFSVPPGLTHHSRTSFCKLHVFLTSFGQISTVHLKELKHRFYRKVICIYFLLLWLIKSHEHGRWIIHSSLEKKLLRTQKSLKFNPKTSAFPFKS